MNSEHSWPWAQSNTKLKNEIDRIERLKVESVFKQLCRSDFWISNDLKVKTLCKKKENGEDCTGSSLDVGRPSDIRLFYEKLICSHVIPSMFYSLIHRSATKQCKTACGQWMIVSIIQNNSLSTFSIVRCSFCFIRFLFRFHHRYAFEMSNEHYFALNIEINSNTEFLLNVPLELINSKVIAAVWSNCVQKCWIIGAFYSIEWFSEFEKKKNNNNKKQWTCAVIGHPIQFQIEWIVFSLSK